MLIILALTLTAVTLARFGNPGVAQGQANTTIGNLTITPREKAAICDPNNPKLNFVNTTESKICGIPKTITNATSTSANMTTGAQTAPIALSATS
jgi:hypothetical protein